MHPVRLAVATAMLVALITVNTAFGGGHPVPDASGNQNVQSGPGVYDQTTDEYAGSWTWTQQSAPYAYYWYVFHSSGTLASSGHKPTGGGDSWTGAANVYYFKEYNDEPAGSGHINILDVNYCC
jgi:hypothetical protein